MVIVNDFTYVSVFLSVYALTIDYTSTLHPVTPKNTVQLWYLYMYSGTIRTGTTRTFTGTLLKSPREL